MFSVEHNTLTHTERELEMATENDYPTYREWLADTLDIDEDEINKWDHYDKDSLAMYRHLYPQADLLT
jgi:hypothetical protein